MPLAGNSRKIFEFKGVRGKIFRNKDLARRPSHFGTSGVVWHHWGDPNWESRQFSKIKSAECFWAAPRVPLGGRARPCPNQEALSHGAVWMSVTAVTRVCDERGVALVPA